MCGPCGQSRPTSRLARAGRTWWPVLATDALTARRNRSHALAAPLLRARRPAGLAIRAEQENRGLASGNRGGLLDGFENHERASCVICWRGLSGRRRRSRHEPPAPRRTGQTRRHHDPIACRGLPRLAAAVTDSTGSCAAIRSFQRYERLSTACSSPKAGTSATASAGRPSTSAMATFRAVAAAREPRNRVPAASRLFQPFQRTDRADRISVACDRSRMGRIDHNRGREQRESRIWPTDR